MDQMALKELNRPTNLRVEFFFDEDRGTELCKISKVGDYNDIIKKVTPELVQQWPREWDVYQKNAGTKDTDIGGTPLRDVPGVDRDAASILRYNGVRNAEELAALEEQTARNLGMNFNEFRKSAILLLAARQKAEQDKELIELRALLEEKKKRGPGRPRKDETEQASFDEAPDAA